jgi:hypothetical protein
MANALAVDTPTSSARSRESYIEWAPVFGGAIIALAVSIVLLTFGAAIGLSAVSPFTSTLKGAKAAAYGSAFWSLLVTIWSLGLGGYFAGRLRHKIGETTEAEMKFRDAAHGLLAWGVFVLVISWLSAAGLATVGRGVSSFAQAPTGAEPAALATDTLLRGTKGPNTADMRQEVGRIIARSARDGELSTADRAYLITIVAANTGTSTPDAEKRVNDAFNDLKASLDHLRKVGIIFGFWMAATLLIGAATATAAATLGGQHREDEIHWEGFAWTPWQPRMAHSERLHLDLDKQDLEALDAFRSKNNLTSRHEALREIVRRALALQAARDAGTAMRDAPPTSPKVTPLPKDSKTEAE